MISLTLCCVAEEPSAVLSRVSVMSSTRHSMSLARLTCLIFFSKATLVDSMEAR